MGFVVGSIDTHEIDSTLLEMYRKNREIGSTFADAYYDLNAIYSVQDNLFSSLNSQIQTLETYYHILEDLSDLDNPYPDWLRVYNLWAAAISKYTDLITKYGTKDAPLSTYWKPFSDAVFETNVWKDYSMAYAIVRSIGTGNFTSNTKLYPNDYYGHKILDYVSFPSHIYIQLGTWSYADGDPYVPNKWMGSVPAGSDGTIYLVLDITNANGVTPGYSTGTGVNPTKVYRINNLGWSFDIYACYKVAVDGKDTFIRANDGNTRYTGNLSYSAEVGIQFLATQAVGTYNNTTEPNDTRVTLGVNTWRNGYVSTSGAGVIQDAPWWRYDDVVNSDEYKAFQSEVQAYQTAWADYANSMVEFSTAKSAYQSKWNSWIGTKSERQKWRVDTWELSDPEMYTSIPYYNLMVTTHPGPFTQFGYDYP